VIQFAPPESLSVVYKALLDEAFANLDEWARSEDPRNLAEAIKCLRVIEYYSSPEPDTSSG
jgi:hypothetical protein